MTTRREAANSRSQVVLEVLTKALNATPTARSTPLLCRRSSTRLELFSRPGQGRRVVEVRRGPTGHRPQRLSILDLYEVSLELRR